MADITFVKKFLGNPLRSIYGYKIRRHILCNILLVFCILSSAVILSTNETDAVSSGDATARGCRDGGFQNMNRVNPHYVSVLPGNVQTEVTGEIRESKVTHEDWPFDHTSHDRTALVKVDPGLENLNSEVNFREGSDLLLEFEWEIGSVNDGRTDRFPKQFWPSEGDKVWSLGRWIFDCGHPPARSEIHPPSAVAFSHFEPFIFPIAGMEKLPVLSTKTSIYIHGQGGPIFSTNVADRDYVFDVELPPKPTASSTVLFDVEVPNRESQSEGVQPGNAPVLDKGPFLKNGKQHITIRYPLNSFPDSPNHKFGAIVHAGWVESVSGQSVPSQANTYHKLRITFDSITKNTPLNSRLDRTGPLGIFAPTHTWDNQWVDVNGQHIELLGPQKGRFFSAAHGNPSGNVRPLFSPDVDVIVPDNGALKIKTTGFLSSEMDKGFGLPFNPGNALKFLHANTDPEFLGIVNTLLDSTKTFGIGATHNDCSGSNKIGGNCEFTLKYTIREIERLTVQSSHPLQFLQHSAPIPPTPAPIPPTPAPIPPTPAPIPPTPAPIPPTPRPVPPSPFPTETCDPGASLIREGSRGPLVERLQRLLIERGFDPGVVDGIFGPNTKRAVVAFQTSNGLDPDGIVGPLTWGKLCSTTPILTPSTSTKVMGPTFVSLVSEQPDGSTSEPFSEESGEEDSEVGEIFSEQDWIMQDATAGVTFEQLESLMTNTTNPINATFDNSGNLVIQPVTNYINDSSPQQQPTSGSLNNSMTELLSQTEGIIIGSPINGSSVGNFTFEQISSENVTAPDNFTAGQLQPQQPLLDEFGNVIATDNATALDNFTQPLQPQQPLVDEFGNVIATDNATALDNFTQPLQPQQPLVDEFGNVIATDNATALDNFTQPLQPQQPLLDEFGNVIPQFPADNFTQPLQPQQPLVDEFGNVIPQFPADNFTQPLQPQQPLLDEFGNVIPQFPADNFTQPLQPQQPLVDEFGNVIATDNATAPPPIDQSSQSSVPAFENLQDCIDYFVSQGMGNLEIREQCGLPS